VIAVALQTDEYVTTATATGTGTSVTATALVLNQVGSQWDQPEKVRGLVNTMGWEDGANISRDGEWLFIHYAPMSGSCLIENNDAACRRAMGPWQIPERPDFPGANRIDADGTVHNGCPSFGLSEAWADSVGMFFVPQALYGFRRQPDDSFAEPFVIAFADTDGCVPAAGPVVLTSGGADAMLIFFYDQPADNDYCGAAPGTDTVADIYAANITLGAPVILGRYQTNCVVTDALGVPLGGAGLPGHQGNAGVFGFSPAEARFVFYDDETALDANRNLFVEEVLPGGSFPGGPFGPAYELPAPVNAPDQGEIQPFFDGTTLTFRRGHNIVSSRWTDTGSGFFDPASWTEAEIDLAPDPQSWNTSGAIVTAGESTIAVRSGKRLLYFVYGVSSPDGTLDLNVGFVQER